MRKSLFALESTDDTGVDAEMETGVEEGEVAAVMADGAEDMADISETSDAVAEGTEAAAQMGEVEDLVEDAVENGEGLEPVAAEAIRISVEAICARVGANPRAVYSLYATENFQSASSRKANSRIALEGIGQFLKDLWERIKASLKSLWEKVKAFFDKQISSLGRIKKALDSAKAKVAASSGKLKGTASVEAAPSGLISIFAGKGQINTASVDKYISAHTKATDEVKGMIAKKTVDMGFNSDGTAVANVPGLQAELGTKSEPLAGGKFIVVKFVKGSTDSEEKPTFEVTREVTDEKDEKRGAMLADKAELTKTIQATLALISSTIDFKAKFDKYSAESNKGLQEINTKLNGFEKSKNAGDNAKAKDGREALNLYYKIGAKLPSVFAEVQSANITLAKGVLGFTSMCLKNYK